MQEKKKTSKTKVHCGDSVHFQIDNFIFVVLRSKPNLGNLKPVFYANYTYDTRSNYITKNKTAMYGYI